MVEKNAPKHSLRVILDIPTLKNKYSETIQRYADNEFFEFIGLGSSPKFTELKIDFENKSLALEREEWSFPYTEEMIKTLAEGRDLKVEEVQLLYIVRTVASDRNAKAILVTERKKLLNYKKYVPDKLPDFTIFSPEEAKIFIDLFCKKHDAYFVRPQYFVNRGLWYLYSMRSKLQQFQLAWSINVNSKDPLDLRDKELQMLVLQ